jgi:Holliday junction resolvase RusA-like endonuclease
MNQTPIYALLDMPVPPSENSAYLNLPGRGRCPSKTLRDYKDKIHVWSMQNHAFIQYLRRELHGAEVLKVDFTLALHYKSLYTKDFRVKRLDATNRIKCCFDCLSDILAIDDRHFFSGTYAKVICPPERGEHSQLLIQRSTAKELRSYAEGTVISNLAFKSN